VKKYVENILDIIKINNEDSDEIIMALNAFALITFFTQTTNFGLNEIAVFFNFDKMEETDKHQCVKNWIATFPIIVNREGGYRFAHPLIAKEWLNITLMVDVAESGGKNLLEFVKLFSSKLAPIYPKDSNRLNTIFRELFMHREIIEDESGRKPKFSQLLLSLTKRENGVEILKHLIRETPSNPHCHNHLARVYLYMEDAEHGVDCENAEKSAANAVWCSTNNKKPESAHYHVQGLVFMEWCIKKINELHRGSNEAIMNGMKYYYDEAVNAFDKSTSTAKYNRGYGIIAKIQLVNRILKEFKKFRRNWNNDFSKSEVFADLLAMACEAMTIYRQRNPEPTSYFYQATDEYYNLIGNVDKLEHFLKDDLRDIKQRAYINRAIVGIIMKNKFSRKESLTWLASSPDQVERAFSRVSENIENKHDTEGDRWNWFELFRLLPKRFELHRAYQFVKEWPKGDNNLDVCYYRYSLAYLLYVNGKIPAKEVRTHMRRSIELCNMGRIYDSHAKNRHATLDYCGLYGSDNDVDQFLRMSLSFSLFEHNETDKDENNETILHENTYKNLRREKCQYLKGIVSKHQRVLRVTWEDERGETFFAETPHIESHGLSETDISRGIWVSFCLGFSCSGFRAWDLEKIL
jgi:hypothetical protein